MNDVNAYLVVALLGTYTVNTVRVWNRFDYWSDHLTPFRVDTRLYSGPWTECGTVTEASAVGKMHEVDCDGVMASYVRVIQTREAPNILVVAEVQVYGAPFGKGTWQSWL